MITTEMLEAAGCKFDGIFAYDAANESCVEIERSVGRWQLWHPDTLTKSPKAFPPLYRLIRGSEMQQKIKRPRHARKPKRKASVAETSEFENDPTPERLRQARDQVDGFKTDSGRMVKRVNSILDHMLSRGMIDGPLYQAGMAAYNHWYLGGLAPIGAVDLAKERVDGGGNGDPMQRRMDNALKHQIAMASLTGPHKRAFVVLVLNEIHVAVFGREYYGYRRVETASAVAYSMLRDALAGLVKHYSGSHPRTDSPGILAHMDETTRPTNRPDIREKVG